MPMLHPPECRDHTRLDQWLQPSERDPSHLSGDMYRNYKIRLLNRMYDVSNRPAYIGHEKRLRSKGYRQRDLQRLFNRLADAWAAETAHLSLISQKAMHPNYQRIIGLGRRAIPLILERLSAQPGHWFWALRAIVGDDEDPVRPKDIGRFDAMREAWLAWGRKRRLLQ